MDDLVRWTVYVLQFINSVFISYSSYTVSLDLQLLSSYPPATPFLASALEYCTLW